MEDLKLRLRILDATIAAIQGIDYIKLRLFVANIHAVLSTQEELQLKDKWFFDFASKGYGFTTYEPDQVSLL